MICLVYLILKSVNLIKYKIIVRKIEKNILYYK